MDRNTERGQMIIETFVLILLFVGFFLIAVGLTEKSEHGEKAYRFQSSSQGARR